MCQSIQHTLRCISGFFGSWSNLLLVPTLVMLSSISIWCRDPPSLVSCFLRVWGEGAWQVRSELEVTVRVSW